MSETRLPRAVCTVVADVVGGSHPTRERKFLDAGIPGPPPDLSHDSKWTTWLYEAGQNPEVDILRAVGLLLEEFMDVPPLGHDPLSAALGGNPSALFNSWKAKRQRIEAVLSQHGLTYFPGGRVMRTDETPLTVAAGKERPQVEAVAAPSNVETVLRTLVRGLPRAMQPLIRRRKDAQPLSFASEYDIQDLLHSLMRPWINDIRPEENAPCVAGTGTRMDFLLPAHRLVIEVKRVRSAAHAKTLGNELILDVAHYREHALCDRLWCVVYDPEHFIANQPGFITDIEKQSSDRLQVTVFISAP